MLLLYFALWVKLSRALSNGVFQSDHPYQHGSQTQTLQTTCNNILFTFVKFHTSGYDDYVEITTKKFNETFNEPGPEHGGSTNMLMHGYRRFYGEIISQQYVISSSNFSFTFFARNESATGDHFGYQIDWTCYETGLRHHQTTH